MRDCIHYASSPLAENCAQLGSPDYHERARKECNALIRQLRRVFGKEPPGARLAVKANAHDFGTYYDVVCYFEADDPAAEKYAFDIDANLPEEWDERAKLDLDITTIV